MEFTLETRSDKAGGGGTEPLAGALVVREASAAELVQTEGRTRAVSKRRYDGVLEVPPTLTSLLSPLLPLLLSVVPPQTLRQQHLSSTQHAPPPSVRGHDVRRERRERSPVGEPVQGVFVGSS